MDSEKYDKKFAEFVKFYSVSDAELDIVLLAFHAGWLARKA